MRVPSEQSFEELRDRQRSVQSDTMRFRTLEHYNNELFFDTDKVTPSDVVCMLGRPTLRQAVSLETVATNLLNRNRTGSPLRIADMGAGYEVALRQLHWSLPRDRAVETTAVDVRPFGIKAVAGWVKAAISIDTPGADSAKFEPRAVQADITTVKLNEPADMIVSVQALQYVHDPIRAVANWYNQLLPSGVMLVATGTAMSESAVQASADQKPWQQLRTSLQAAQIPVATALRMQRSKPACAEDTATVFNVFAVRKRVATAIKLQAAVVETKADNNGFTTVSYEPGVPVVSVIRV